MANGYIGKISAVVTANTSDLSRKLQGAVKDVDRFAQTLNRSVSASAQQATASLEKIFTPLQRLERKLQTALQLNLRTDDEVRKIQQLVSVAEGINKPLERASGAFSKLSLEVLLNLPNVKDLHTRFSLGEVKADAALPLSHLKAR